MGQQRLAVISPFRDQVRRATRGGQGLGGGLADGRQARFGRQVAPGEQGQGIVHRVAAGEEQDLRWRGQQAAGGLQIPSRFDIDGRERDRPAPSHLDQPAQGRGLILGAGDQDPPAGKITGFGHGQPQMNRSQSSGLAYSHFGY